MYLPELGQLEKEEENGWYISPAVSIPALDDDQYCFLIDGMDDDAHPEDFQAAISNFLALRRDTLEAVQEQIFAYYRDCVVQNKAAGRSTVDIATPEAVWQHIQFCDEILACRRQTGDRAVYISLECDCDWEEELGLQLIFKRGQRISKLGPFDDFLSNADVYGLPELDSVIYQSKG